MHLIICPPNGNVPLLHKSGIKICATLWTHGFVHTRHRNAMIPNLKHTLTTKHFPIIRITDETLHAFTNATEVSVKQW